MYGSWDGKSSSPPPSMESSIEAVSDDYARRWEALSAPDPPAYEKAKDETRSKDAEVVYPLPPSYEDAVKASPSRLSKWWRPWAALLATIIIALLLTMSTSHWWGRRPTLQRLAPLEPPQLTPCPGKVPLPPAHDPVENIGSPQPAGGGGGGGGRVIRYGGAGGGGGGGGGHGGGQQWKRDKRAKSKERELDHGEKDHKQVICEREDLRRRRPRAPKAPRSKEPRSLGKGTTNPSLRPPSQPSGGITNYPPCLSRVPDWEGLKELPGIDPRKETYALCQQAHGYRLPDTVSVKDLKVLSSPSVHGGRLTTKFHSSSLEAMNQLLYLRPQGLPLISATWTLRLLQYTYRRKKGRSRRRRFGAQLQIIWYFDRAWKFENAADQRLLERCAHLEASAILGLPLEGTTDFDRNHTFHFDLQGGSKWEWSLLKDFLTHQCYRFSGDLTHNRPPLFAPPTMSHTRRMYWRGGGPTAGGKGKATGNKDEKGATAKVRTQAALPPQHWFTSLSIKQAVPLPSSRSRPPATMMSPACTGRGLMGRADARCICSHGFGGPRCEDRLKDSLLPSTRGRRPRDTHSLSIAELTPYDLLSNPPSFTGAHHVYYGNDGNGGGLSIQAVLPLPLPPPLYFRGRPLIWRLPQQLPCPSQPTRISSPIRSVHQDAQGRLRSLDLANGQILPDPKMEALHAGAVHGSNRARMQYVRELLPGQLLLAPRHDQLFILQASSAGPEDQEGRPGNVSPSAK